MTDWEKHINEKAVGASIPQVVTDRFVGGDSLANLYEDHGEDPRVLIAAYVDWLENKVKELLEIIDE